MARIIKRYDNRKLYDTEASSYVSQKDVAELVRNGETVHVVDNSTGEDLTAQTLTQIILEEGKNDGRSLLPTELLHGLLRRGSKAAGQALDQTIGQGARQVSQGFGQVKKSVDDLVHQSLVRLNTLARSVSGEAARTDDVDALHEQLADLEARLATLLDRMEESEKDDERPPMGGRPDA